MLAYSKQTCKQHPYETPLTKAKTYHTACLCLHNRIVTNNFPSRLPPVGPSCLGLVQAAAELVPRRQSRTGTIVETKQSSGFIVSLAQVSPLPASRGTCAGEGLSRPCQDNHYQSLPTPENKCKVSGRLICGLDKYPDTFC